MIILVIGLILFFVPHILPWSPPLRQRLIDRAGAGPYRLLFSLVSVAGLVLIVVGMGRTATVPLWQPPSWSRGLVQAAMFPALVLMAAAYLPSGIRRLTRHPMLWAVALWAASHLLANGDLASLLLFGSFLVYALADMGSANARGARLADSGPSPWRELLPVAVGLAAWALIGRYHASLFGVPAFLGQG
jgi:uncharacterized membrane protein